MCLKHLCRGHRMWFLSTKHHVWRWAPGLEVMDYVTKGCSLGTDITLTDIGAEKWTNLSAQKQEVSVTQTRLGTYQGVHNYRFMKSTVISGVSLVYILIMYSVLASITAARETKLAPLLSRQGWPQLVQPRSPYPFPVWERIPTQAHRDPFIALHIKTSFLCSDTLHLICIFTYSEPSVHFLSVRDTGKLGTHETGAFSLVFKGFLSMCLGN